MRHAIMAVLLLAALAGTAVAGPFEDAASPDRHREPPPFAGPDSADHECLEPSLTLLVLVVHDPG